MENVWSLDTFQNNTKHDGLILCCVDGGMSHAQPSPAGKRRNSASLPCVEPLCRKPQAWSEEHCSQATGRVGAAAAAAVATCWSGTLSVWQVLGVLLGKHNKPLIIIFESWREQTNSTSTARRWCPAMLARKWHSTSATGRNSPPGGSCGSTWPKLRRFGTFSD